VKTSRRETLGDRIKRVRTERELGLRETARKVGISATFLSRVEHNDKRAVPGEKVIRTLSVVLEDDFDTMMQLAGRIAHDVASVIKSDVGMPAFLRRVRDQGISSNDLMKLLDLLDKIGR
jgi:transcriptional regulator with XRE-family HTH domain